MDRRTFLKSLPLFAGMGGLPVFPMSRARSLKKFIIITVDTLRPDHLGCYGYPQPTSPALDSFAARSLRFDRAFSTAPFTRPSMVSMLTSRYPGLSEGQFVNRGWDLPDAAPNIAAIMQQQGLQTAAFVGNYAVKDGNDITDGFGTYDATLDSREHNRNYFERICTDLTRPAQNWLEKNHRRPFLLWLHYQDPHGPYTPPEPFSSRFPSDAATDAPLELAADNGGHQGLPPYQKLGEHRRLPYYVAQYDGEIAFTDSALSSLFATIEKLGLFDDTAIFFSSDHGEAFGEHDYYCCHGHYIAPELTRVPLLFYVPGGKPGTCTTPVSLVDIAPTITQLAGTARPETFLGRSLIDTSRAGKRSGPFITESSYAIAAVEDGYMFTWGAPHRDTSTKPNNKKVSHPERIGFYKAPMKLFDIAAAAYPVSDITAGRPEWARYLRGVCQQHLRESARFVKFYRDRPMDPETIKALDTLGYL